MEEEEEEEEKHVMCIDDVTGNELPWHEVRKAREQELKYVRDLGVYEKVDEREAVAQYQGTPVGLIQTQHLRRRPCKSDHELLQESSKVTIDQTCTNGLLH